MMKIIENSKTARILFKGYSAILLFFWLFLKKDMDRYSTAFFAHENCHSRQWVECMLLAVLPFAVAVAIDPMSAVWATPAGVCTFYILYVLNYLVNLAYLALRGETADIWHQAYRRICFEREARHCESTKYLWGTIEGGVPQLSNRKKFNWFYFIRHSFRD